MNNNPRRDDKKINFDQYKQTVETAQRAVNINFDPSKFIVYDDGVSKFVSVLIEPAATEFTPRGTEELFKVCALRYWGVPEPGSPTLSATQLIPVSGDPYGYAETTLEPTWDWVRFTGYSYLSGMD